MTQSAMLQDHNLGMLLVMSKGAAGVIHLCFGPEPHAVDNCLCVTDNVRLSGECRHSPAEPKLGPSSIVPHDNSTASV